MPEYDFDALPAELAEETAPAGTHNTAVHNGTIWKKITLATLKTWLQTQFSTVFQALLVSGTNIKTINSNSLLGSGDIAISGGGGATNLDGLSDVAINSPAQGHMLLRGASEWENRNPTDVKTALALQNVNNTPDASKPISTAQQAALDAKQATLVAGTNIKNINGASILGSGNLTISGGGSGSVYDKLSTYSSFQDFLTQWNTAGNPVKFLVIDTDATINFAASLHKNIVMMPINGAKFIKSGSGYLEMKGVGIACPARTQIFSGFSRTQVRWIGEYPDVVYPEWFGVVGNVDDTTTRNNNSTAATVMLEAFQSDQSVGGTPAAAVSPYGVVTSGKVLFGNAIYNFNDGLTLNAAIDISALPGGMLRFGADKICIRINGNQTRGVTQPFDDVSSNNYGEYATTGASSAGAQTSSPITVTLPTAIPKNILYGWAWLQGGTGNLPANQSVGGYVTNISVDGLTVTIQVLNRFWTTPTHSWQLAPVSVGNPLPAFTGATLRAIRHRSGADALPRIHDIEIRGQRSTATTHTVNINGDNINWVSGEAFDMDNRYAHGYSFTHEGITYMIGNHPDNPAPANQMKLQRFRMFGNRVSANVYYPYTVPYPTVSARWVGATVVHRKTKNTHTITAVNTGAQTFTIDGVDEESGEFWITHLPLANYTGVQIRVDNKSIGIDSRIHCQYENTTVRDCDVGYTFDTIVKPTIGDRVNVGQPNQNNSKAVDIRAFNCRVGIMTRGVNANNISFYNPDIQNCAAAIIDSPQHANSYYSMHVQGAPQGIIAGVASIQGSVFYDPYIEGDGLELDLNYHNAVFGGGASLSNFYSGATEMFVHLSEGGWLGSSYEPRWRGAGGAGTAGAREYFAKIGHQAWKSFLSFGEVTNNLRKKFYHLFHQNTGYYGFQYSSNNDIDNPIGWAYASPLELTTEDAAEGANQVVFGKGMYVQNKFNIARPAASAALRGRFWVDNGTGGQPDKLYWCRLNAAGTGYEWKEVAFV